MIFELSLLISVAWMELETNSKTKNVLKSYSCSEMFFKSASVSRTHTAAISTSNTLYIWKKLDKPEVKTELEGIPLKHVECGDGFTLVLTEDHSLLSFGSNEYGQLGLNPRVIPVCGIENDSFNLYNTRITNDYKLERYSKFIKRRDDNSQAKFVQKLANIAIEQIAVGSGHCVALAYNGYVYSWGLNDKGQLGHGNTFNYDGPTIIKKLVGIPIVKVCCKSKSTIAICALGNVYIFGTFRQNGVNNVSYVEPIILTLLHKPFIIDCAFNENDIILLSRDGSVHLVNYYYDLNTKSIVIDRSISIKSIGLTEKHVLIQSTSNSIYSLPYGEFWDNRILDLKRNKELPGSQIEKGMMNLFLYENYSYRTIPLLISIICDRSISFNTFRIAIRLLSNLQWELEKISISIDVKIELITVLKDYLDIIMDNSGLIFKKNIQVVDISVVDILDFMGNIFETTFEIDYKLFYCDRILEFVELYFDFTLNQINGLTFNDLYIEQPKSGKLADPFPALFQANKLKYFKFTSYSFLFDIHTKFEILEWDFKNIAASNMSRAMMDAVLAGTRGLVSRTGNSIDDRLMFDAVFNMNSEGQSSLRIYHIPDEDEDEHEHENITFTVDEIKLNFKMNVRREFILQDTFAILSNARIEDLMKPFSVKFLNEDAVDHGGVTKEYFYLITRELLKDSNGIFVWLEESKYYWFNSNSNDYEKFKFAGIIFGLAVFNSCIVEGHFPLAFFKTVLGVTCSTEDYSKLFPTIHKNLNELLLLAENCETDKDPIKDLDLTFSITRKKDSSIQNVDLVPGGSFLPVDKFNVKKYVKDYLRFIAEKEISEQIDHFQEGVGSVLCPSVISTFHPLELKLIMMGESCNSLEDLEFFKSDTIYKDYTPVDNTVVYFWEILDSFNLDDRKLFFKFLSGSDRIPFKGLSSIPFTIQRVNDTSRLPVSHTCFNLLDLPDYNDKHILTQKLLFSIHNTEGFGLA
ncbi:Regulator of chromosome condensation 1 domain-containing protein [Rozella allomycis CSF55]|uniref:HECT-type E3 ubiquitin transferase n=2 Tax=Rozella allomycis (strain CSF55) TaxID=988480 RepID=A0A075AN05_ROZAC|nr:Regulator of chromosome condensation 1 domain-containing protein [Rozella allomycis CSF55]|eukprot:EPZ31116.1 Regulator of chromosome condensation 1 domain-containing protein [Rozella allomycis CSF55]